MAKRRQWRGISKVIYGKMQHGGASRKSFPLACVGVDLGSLPQCTQDDDAGTYRIFPEHRDVP